MPPATESFVPLVSSSVAVRAATAPDHQLVVEFGELNDHARELVGASSRGLAGPGSPARASQANGSPWPRVRAVPEPRYKEMEGTP